MGHSFYLFILDIATSFRAAEYKVHLLGKTAYHIYVCVYTHTFIHTYIHTHTQSEIVTYSL